MKYVYIQCIYNIWCSVLIISNHMAILIPLYNRYLLFSFCNAELNFIIKAVQYVVGACNVMTAPSMCCMVHIVSALFVHMKYVCQCLSCLSNSNRRHLQKNGFSLFFFVLNFVTCLSSVILINGSHFFLPAPNNEQVRFSCEVFVVGIYVNA